MYRWVHVGILVAYVQQNSEWYSFFAGSRNQSIATSFERGRRHSGHSIVPGSTKIGQHCYSEQTSGFIGRAHQICLSVCTAFGGHSNAGEKFNTPYLHSILNCSISASNAICAPLTWQQGDLRRPYPTDIEMRLGFLGKSDLNNGHNLQHQSSVGSDVNRSTGKSLSTNDVCVPS